MNVIPPSYLEEIIQIMPWIHDILKLKLYFPEKFTQTHVYQKCNLKNRSLQSFLECFYML